MKSFAEIYTDWSQNHNESEAIRKRCLAEEKILENTITVSELKRMKVQASLDLHNCILEDALPSATGFVERSFVSGLRKIRIVTGKGLHSPNGEAVLRPAVISLLNSNQHVREIDTHPSAADGGSGAIIVILKVSHEQFSKLPS